MKPSSPGPILKSEGLDFIGSDIDCAACNCRNHVLATNVELIRLTLPKGFEAVRIHSVENRVRNPLAVKGMHPSDIGVQHP